MEASEVKRIKELEEENARLKRMYANLAMDNEILRDLFTKKVGPCRQKATITEDFKVPLKVPPKILKPSFVLESKVTSYSS